ncbi:Bud22p SCDLUD_004215 [Saccharomycodes ludwigii]|uniref:Bud22p n=1 Tax=Saccharomycodes ludwigii TaxID=36035 RepID=UPI001E8BACCB|nr:hypothetical protein SCDLUD_004215 [Saccharomycodes ludwigii]KAH3899904.1 hypothetical protein SCDLUD_004215 [Saccharomycodes ludwigii]
MPKENLIFKLDNLEYQYNYLNNSLEKFEPRLITTKKLYNTKSIKKQTILNSKLSKLNREDVFKDLNNLKLDIFNKKVYHLTKKLTTIFQMNQNKKQFQEKLSSSQNHDSDELDAIVDRIVRSKVVKLTIPRMCTYDSTTKNKTAPAWIQSSDFFEIFQDKQNKYNPSIVYSQIIVPLGLNPIISKIFQDKKVRSLVTEFENGLNMLLNKENRKKSREENHNQQAKIQKEQTNGNMHDVEPASTNEVGDSIDKKNDGNLKDEDLDDILAQYKDVVAASSDEEEDTSSNESVSGGRSNDTYTKRKRETDQPQLSAKKISSNKKDEGSSIKKYKLPALQVGYLSNEDNDEDDFFEPEVKEEKPQRKNRRGQRARRKIWEQKFGSGAKHIQRELIKEKELRQQRQLEYEQRQLKRELKAKEREEMDKEKREKNKEMERRSNTKIHPSWEAKKLQEQKLNKVKFEGKKVVFN